MERSANDTTKELTIWIGALLFSWHENKNFLSKKSSRVFSNTVHMHTTHMSVFFSTGSPIGMLPCYASWQYGLILLLGLTTQVKWLFKLSFLQMSVLRNILRRFFKRHGPSVGFLCTNLATPLASITHLSTVQLCFLTTMGMFPWSYIKMTSMPFNRPFYGRFYNSNSLVLWAF